MVVRESSCVDAGAGPRFFRRGPPETPPRAGDYATFDVCAKRHKLVALRDALAHWSRVLLLDDTVAVRADAPDVFGLVPAVAVGATVEDARVRPEAEAARALDLARARYGVERPGDGRWFNSGVVVASWAHASLVARLPAVPLDRALHWDQGFLNAMRVAYEAPLADLGYAFNYVGSFLTANAASRPFESPADAFFVHGTTGLLLPPAERAAFLANVSDAWAARGL